MTRKRRYLISAAVLVACVGIALGVLAMLPDRPGVTKVNFDRVKNGMTLEEVEGIFGKPGFQTGVHPIGDKANPVKENPIMVWVHDDDGALVGIEFGDGEVVDVEWRPSRESFTDKLRRWLHLPLRDPIGTNSLRDSKNAYFDVR